MSVSSEVRPSTLTRRKGPLTSNLEKSLTAYATVAGAAGVSLLALSQPSAAQIVFTAAHRVIVANGSGAIDLNHDGLVDFKVIAFNDPGTDYFFPGSVKLSAFQTNRFVSSGGKFAAALPFGKNIGPDGPFHGGYGKMAAGTLTVSYSGGGCRTSAAPWKQATDRYLGFKFSISGAPHYGWARLSVSGSCGYYTVTLTGYAYESTPNKPIRAGQTSGTDTAEEGLPSVAPQSLGRLALGAAGKSK